MQVLRGVKEAHERTERILQLKRVGGRIIFALGAEFKAVKEEYERNGQTAYELYGYESFAQYHSQPGIAYSSNSVNRFIRLHTTYVEKLGVSADDPNLKMIDYTVLDLMTKFINKENVNDWLNRAVSLGRKDLSLAVRNQGGLEDCEHGDVEVLELKICKACGDTVSKKKL
jgi:hypothetical protein